MANNKVLVVDDEEMIRVNLTCFLEDENFTVLSAESGEEAIELLKENEPVLGIIDMRLPGIDGNAVILEAYKRYPKMAFIIHTGSSEYTIPEALASIGLTPKHIVLYLYQIWPCY
jgi:DNA-binding NtrC family response regulator